MSVKLRFLLVVLGIFLRLSSFAYAATDVGNDAPLLAVQQLDGQKFDLAALKGKVVIVHFWATWCPACREEMPVLDRFYRDTHEKGVEFIALSMDHARHKDDVEKYMKPFPFPVALYEDAEVKDFGSPAALPLTYIIDRNGTISAKLTPENEVLSEQQLAKIVAPLLK